ncbi:MAG: sulfate ABC transporter substrate-binding protein [Pirellulales bacterium]|nr:sulfate ABC transporter substrate-binding protein [Pirellulales bacterium]
MTRIHLACVAAALVLAGLSGCSSEAGNSNSPAIELLNVSYDPTRELWKAINYAFTAKHEKEAGQALNIRVTHAGSSSQARSVIEGLEADVVTLAMWTDTDAVARAGLIDAGWESELPNNALPYSSTIVFVVRKGNPKQIQDWPDLLKQGVEIITPNPKTSGNGKLSFLAAWGAALDRGGSEADALAYVTELFKHVPVLDSGARAATVTFAQKKIGDVHLTWENEARLEVQEAQGELEIVYPSASILAEPLVAVVDANVKRHGTADIAREYLEFLYTEEAQEIIARNYYRPSKEAILAKHKEDFPEIRLFRISAVAKDWADAHARYFAEGAVFDKISEGSRGEQ